MLGQLGGLMPSVLTPRPRKRFLEAYRSHALAKLSGYAVAPSGLALRALTEKHNTSSGKATTSQKALVTPTSFPSASMAGFENLSLRKSGRSGFASSFARMAADRGSSASVSK
jgi:hypothetical protein